jgi:TPR repeat protein
MAPSERAKQVMRAARTDPAAAFQLAGWYCFGEEGLHQSPELAFKWNLQAAEGGHLEAQGYVGCAYGDGEGVAVNHAVAAPWLEKAAGRGHRISQYNLGSAFEEGTKGVEQNYELAAGWYQRAADQGHTRAMVNLGNLYDAGQGVEQDYQHANALYREAFEVGKDNDTHALVNALSNLGINYRKGLGVEQSLATALSFWQRAADLGHARCQYRVGWAYMEGRGGYEKNAQLARQYIKASAAQGNVEAVALLKKLNACAHYGTDAAPKVCPRCMTARYCNAVCQRHHWTDPADPHRALCGGRRC